ncbi:alpha amylase N-terminal ig-like domain-containing protein [Palaeococcus ferrophilus]|uniref:alpha amylase N-terminal ig-like domain-containing protein n=1 Tax=Palaeococcus ferrophilus TaxID=83868 RepID=UPI00064F531A|nr:alpha amylase N-terminal ig-like domain-containing protein [Palaeococcus ferrophilus]
MYKTFGFVHDDVFGRLARVEFSLPADGDYAYLIGSFNAFNEGSFRMRREGERWRIEVLLPEGRWHYAFSVGGEFTPDPENPLRERYVRPSYKFDRETSVAVVAGGEALFHAPSLTYLYSIAGRTHVVLRARKGLVKKAYLLDGGRVEMRRKASDGLFDYFEAVLEGADEFSYSFEALTKEGTVEYGPFTAAPGRLEVPGWAFESVFYQIMPDRFAKGFEKSSLTPGERFHGGDLRGIVEHLNHLEGLGVNALYLTPIFVSRTYHGYDIEDYFHVGEQFGGDETFEELVRVLRERGMKLVLDGVFHHTSFFHPYFQDVVAKGEKSEYRDFYRIKGFPALPEGFLEVLNSSLPWVEKYRKLKEFEWNYESFFSVWLMPRLNHDNPRVKKFVRDVLVHWLERGADGFRLDVAHGVPPDFWRDVLEGLEGKAYLFGEVMDDPSLFLGPFHGTMNYPLYELLLRFFAGGMRAEEFLNGIELLSARYGPFEYVMYNFLDNHDIDRFLHIAGRERYLCALAFLMTYRGIPSLFYGDEIGLDHFDAPFMERSRKPMEWNEERWDREILNTTRELIKLRRKSRALQVGEFVPIVASGGVIVYERHHDGERVIVGINVSDRAFEIELPTNFIPVVGHADGKSLPPRSFFVGRWGE